MGDKVFKTYDEQISILENRGMELLDKKECQNAKKVIQRVGYYKLINGYKTPFLNTTAPTETYLPGTRNSHFHCTISAWIILQLSTFIP